MIVFTPKEISRFWSHIEKKDGDCWLWKGTIFKNGYGRVRFGFHTCVAHRVAYQLGKGDIPDDILVLHKCDVRNCCNPEHLFLGTDADNVHDCQNKNRRFVSPCGEKHPMAKLSKDDVSIIRKLRRSGEKLASIAKRFSVTPQLICLISNNKIWRKNELSSTSSDNDRG